MKTLKIMMLSVLLVILTTAFANAQPRFKQHHHRAGLGIEKLEEELALTEEQLTTLKKQRFESQKNAIEMRSRIQVAELELRNLMKGGNEADIKNKVKEIGNLKTDLRLNRVETRLAMKKVLTEEQLEELQSLRKQHLKKRMNYRGQNQMGPHRRHPRQFRNFRGHQPGFGLEEFDMESSEVYDEEVIEKGAKI